MLIYPDYPIEDGAPALCLTFFLERMGSHLDSGASKLEFDSQVHAQES